MSSLSAAEEKSKRSLAMLYIQVLKDLNIVGRIDEDGDIKFVSPDAGLHMIAIVDMNHKEFVRLTIPGIYGANEKPMLETLEACNHANLKSKGAKVYVPESAKFVWVAYEVVVSSLDAAQLKHTIETGIKLTEAAALRFIRFVDKIE